MRMISEAFNDFLTAASNRHIDILMLAETLFVGGIEVSPDSIPQFIATASAMHPDILEMPEYHEFHRIITHNKAIDSDPENQADQK